MSDRDDIDVIGSAENNAKSDSEGGKPEDSSSSNNKFNQAIRQNPLTHSDEKPAKKGFFEKLKRAFSTEDSVIDSPEENINGGLIEDGDGFSGFVNKFKRNKTNGGEAENNLEKKSDVEKTDKNTDNNIDKNNTNQAEEKTDTQNSEIEENTAEFDPEEEEEFKMISAFLEGEEYISPTLDENVNSEIVSETQSVEIKTDDKIISEAEIKITEYDAQDALENEEANFDVKGAFDNEEAEFIMIDIDDEAEFSDNLDDISQDENTDNKSEEVKPEEKTDEKSEEVKPEEKTDEKSEEAKPEEKTDEKSEEVKPEEKTDEKSEEVKPEEKTDEKSEEIKPEEKTDEKSEEIKPEEKTDEKSEEAKPEEKTDEKSEEIKPEEKTDEKFEEAKPEEKTDEKSEEIKPEEKSDEKTEEVKNNKNSDGIEVEVINAEGDKSLLDDDLDDDDEEIQFDEDYVFDESDDDDFDDLADLDDIDDFKDLEGLFNTSQNPKDNKSNEISEDKKEDKPAEIIPDSDKVSVHEEKKEPEKSEEVKVEEKSDEKTDTPENNNQDKPQNSSESDPGEKIEEKSETSENSEIKPTDEKHNEFIEISSNPDSGEIKANNVKRKSNSAFGKIKTVFSKTKSKIVQMWNTKDDGTVVANVKTPEVKDPITDKSEGVKDNVIDIKAVTDESKSENEKYSDVFEIDSESTEVTVANSENPNVEDISEKEKSTDNESKSKIIPMTVIKNENAAVVPIDREKVRESLRVIESDKTVSEPDILTDEQKHQLEMNQKVLEKVKQYEEETAEKREEMRKARAERSAKAYEKAFGTVDRITEVEITDYLNNESEEIIKVKAGKFSESVRSEYEFYVGYTRLKNVAKQQTKAEPVQPRTEVPNNAPKAAPAEKTKLDESSYAEFSEDKFAKSRDRLDSISKRLDYKDSKNPERMEYRTDDDAVKIKKVLQENLKKAKMQWNMSIGLTFAMFVLCCIGGAFTIGKGEDAKDSSMRVFAFINIAIYGAMLYNCRDIILRGLQPLKKIKSNSDTGYAVAAVITAIQSVIALFTPTPFFRQGLNVYTLVVMLALAMNSMGRQRNADRISSNFRFVSDSSQKYTGKFFHDQRMVATLLSGTRNDKSELVFQKKTSFLKHFMKLSYSPDPGEDLADKFSLPTIVFSLIISIVYLFLSKSPADSLSVLSIMLCAAVPMCSKALGAVPLHKLAKNSLANQSMVVGYQAVESFSESAAVMLDAKELYPEGSVHLNGIKTFDTRRIDDAMLAAASVIITAGGAMAGMFDGIIQGDKQENLPTAENVIYEDGKGLIGWVNNERIFVGNRQLLRSHGIEPMTEEYEEEQKSDGDEILYLACAGELVAMFIVGYSANRRVADALRRMEANGMSMLIRTTDVNITAERIAKDFGVSHRSIKILEQKNSNVVRDEMIGKEKSSPAFVATKGGVTSFGRAVSGCIQTKRDISLSLAVQVFGVLLGLLIVTVIALVSGVHHIGAIQMFFFYLFWVAAVLAAPPIIQRIQKY